jgi:hypothetical protein
MLAGIDKLKELEATYVKTNRGGDITYHGYGQIVGYPVLDLENFFTDIHLYMRNLEEVIIRTIAEYGLKGERSPGRNRCMAGCRETLCKKNVCDGSESFPMGNPSWFCIECEYGYALF